ncbi:MAG: hypothetical protein ACFFC3_12955 [Candidatus Odinarchaeota archaeon]
MSEILFIIPLIISFIFMLCIGIYTIFFFFTHPEKFGTKFNAKLNAISILHACILYSGFYFISIILFFSEAINIILWKISLIFGFISLMWIALMYAFLKEFKKIPYFPFLYFMIFFGLLLSSIMMPDSIQVSVNYSNSPPFLILNISKINYKFNFITGILTGIFQMSFVLYFIYLSYAIYKEARNKAALKGLILISFTFSFPMLMFNFYSIFQSWIFREIFIFSLWIDLVSLCLVIVKKPEVFSELTNKIYYINIYHKSGILLFSYKFKNIQNEVDSSIWGNILIGINHILSEFVYTKDHIDVLQTKNSDIIVNYDELGFAVVLITNHKNDIIKELMDNFSKEFRNKFRSELTEIQDLNKLINVSEFKETQEIIEKNFQIFLG